MATARQLHIEAIQTVTPAKASDPGQSRRVTSSVTVLSDLPQSHHRFVACYKKPEEEEKDDSGHALAGWFKESLNATLSEYPVFAGRLRRNEEEGKVELKLTDAGVRLVQARAEMSMSEFMELKGADEREALLAYWVEVDKKNPQYSALCYVQVTSFQGDGYSIGVSCSLLVADTILLTKFIKTWAHIHTRMLTGNHFDRMPVFHLSKFKRSGVVTHLESTPLDSKLAIKTTNHTVLFQIPTATAKQIEALDALCHGEAIKTGGKPDSEYYLVTGGSGEVKVEHHVREVENVSWSDGGVEGAARVALSDVVADEELALGKRNKPVFVSYNVQSGKEIVQVMLPSDHHFGLITATVLKKI